MAARCCSEDLPMMTTPDEPRPVRVHLVVDVAAYVEVMRDA